MSSSIWFRLAVNSIEKRSDDVSHHPCSDTETLVQTLAGTRSFREVPEETLRQLVETGRCQSIPGGASLFRPGQPYEQKLYIMLEGTMVMHRPTGRQDSVLPGDFLGLANYLDKNPHTARAFAVNESRVLVLEDADVKRLEGELPELFNTFNRIIATKLRERSPDRSISTGILAQPVTRIMKTSVATCEPDTTLRQAFEIMRDRKIGSLIVNDDDGRLKGLLTYFGLSRAMIEEGAQPEDRVADMALGIPRVIEADTPLWEAEEIQRRYNTKYLVVLEQMQPIGILSKTDLIGALISRPSVLASRLRKADSITQLSELAEGLVAAAVESQETNHRPSDAIRLLSEAHLVVQRRAVELTLQWMQHKGYGAPPLDFALLVMGSGGRKEMLLDPDQDNGIIIEDSPEAEEPEVIEWFERFCKRVNRNLDKVGYPLCGGEIMARNPLYRKTLSQWKRQIEHIVSKPTEKAARWSNVVFDFDTLYGSDGLTLELRRHVLEQIQEQPRLLKMMTDDDAEGRPAIGLFNRLITTTSEDKIELIDMKRNGLRIIADGARIFALQNGVASTNTSDRLNALVRVGKLSADFKDSIQEAFEEILDLVLTHQIRQARRHDPINKLVDPAKLSRQSRSTLRMAMRAVKRFQEKLQDDYATDIF